MKKSTLAIYVLSITANADVFHPSTMLELKDALSTAATNSEDDTINLSGTYSSSELTTGFLDIPMISNGDTITIVGTGEATTTIQGDGANPIFAATNVWTDYSTYAPTIIFKDMTITDGYCVNPTGCEGGQNESSILGGLGMNVELENVTLTDNESRRGAISGYSIKATNVTGNDNLAYDGGVFYASNTLYIKDSSFEGNKADWAGGVAVGNANGVVGSSTTILNSDFTDNIAIKFGGAIYTITEHLIVNDSNFVGNEVVVGNGGALNSRETGTITIDNSVFTNNAASYVGDPEHCEEGAVERNFCLAEGGAISIDDFYGATLTVTNSTFTGNSAEGAGGAIGLDGTCSTTYPDPAFPENCPAYAGQPIATIHTITDTVFEDNTAGVLDSGAIYSSSGTVRGTTWTYGDITFSGVSFIGNNVYSMEDLFNVTVTPSTIVEPPVVVTPPVVVEPEVETKKSSGGSTSLFGLLMLSAISLVRRNKRIQ